MGPAAGCPRCQSRRWGRRGPSKRRCPQRSSSTGWTSGTRSPPWASSTRARRTARPPRRRLVRPRRRRVARVRRRLPAPPRAALRGPRRRQGPPPVRVPRLVLRRRRRLPVHPPGPRPRPPGAQEQQGVRGVVPQRGPEPSPVVLPEDGGRVQGRAAEVRRKRPPYFAEIDDPS
jgi:hypothetical protein